MVLGYLQQAAPAKAWLIPVAVACLLFCAGPSWAEQPYGFSLTELTTEEELDLELLTDGKPLIVHIWAIDCPHCKLHMPYVAALYNKLDFDEVNFITLAMTGDPEDTKDYLQEKSLEFAVLWAPSGDYDKRFEKHGWPTTFVFAPGGSYIGWCDTNGPAYITEVLELVAQANRS
jgi:thiol-disulfide isomerase/thioredoxin